LDLNLDVDAMRSDGMILNAEFAKAHIGENGKVQVED
jgi:hypothetical protein